MLTARVKGQGTILMSISGNTTMSHDVGSFRPNDERPTSLTVETDFEAYRREKYTDRRSYIGTYIPSYYDTCIPVENKGYGSEISQGKEYLSASGTVTAKQIKVSYGTERELKNEFSVGGSWPPAGNANFGHGQTDTEKWGWTLEDHSGNVSTPLTSISGFFRVTLTDTAVSGSQTGQPPGPPCTTCPNCDRSVITVTDHLKGTCPMDGTADGCGKKIYNCTPEEEALQDSWHTERTCELGDNFLDPWWIKCNTKFRHCTNGRCWYRWRSWRGHSDGTTSQAPSSVINQYAESHFVDDPPAMAVCTISDCQDSTPYDPNSSSAGLHAYHSECYRYKCTGGGHSWYPSCTDTTHTNANGDSCTVAGYECVSHTPMYPAPPTTVTCGQCSVSYNPQGSLASRHELIPCPRTRIAHDLACGESFYRCSNTNTCIWNWRHSSWNDDPEL